MEKTIKTGKRLNSIQKTYLPLREVRGSVLCLEDPQRPGERLYRVIVEVTGINYALLGSEEQQGIFVRFQKWLATLTFATQMITRVAPLDVEMYLRYVAPRGVDAGEVGKPFWRELAESHVDWLREVTQDQTLLERRFYIVIPADDMRVAFGLFSAFRPKKRAEQEALTFTQAEQQLHLRRESLTAHLENMGLRVDLLEGDQLVQLYDEMLGGVGRARAYPLTEEMLKDGQDGLCLDDVLAPSSIRLEPGHIVIDEGQYLRVLAVRGLPRSVLPGFLYRLVQSQEILDLVMHQFPWKEQEATRILRRKQSQYESAVIYAESQGKKIDPMTRMAASDVGPLLDAIVAGSEQLHDFAFHVLLRAENKEALEKRTRRVEELLYTLCHSRPQTLLYEQQSGFRLSLPGNLFIRDTMSLDSSSVAACYPFFSNLLYRPGEDSVLVGVTPEREPIVINLFELPNYNWFIVGPSGSGKSFAVKTVALRIFMTYQAKAERERRRENAQTLRFQLFVIDPEREWHRLNSHIGGQWVRLSPGSSHHMNPFDLPRRRETQRQDDEVKEDVLANQIQLLHHILDAMLSNRSVDNEREATLTVQEKALLDAALYECYRKLGITPDPATHGRKPPLLRDLYHILENGDVGPDHTGLAQRLRRFVSGSLSGLFSNSTNVDLDNPVVCFDVRELDGELRPIGLMMVSQLVWNLSYASMIPRWLIIDELATLCKYRSGERFAREMFRRFRKMFGGVIGITQEPDTHPDIVNNCAIHVLMKQSHSTLSRIVELEGLSEQEARYVSTCQKGQGLILVDGKRMSADFVASPLEYRLATTDPRELAQFERERREQNAG
jgi:hypothetical protein